MKILITGGTGYIGSNLAKRLLELNHEVCLLVRENSSEALINPIKSHLKFYIHQSDILSLIDFFKDYRPEAVFHLAASTIIEHQSQDIEKLITTNILFFNQLLEAMQKAGTRLIINTGTCWQHYENAAYNPTCLYAATKQCAEDILKYYHEAHQISAITLALFDTYGPADPRKKLLNLLQETCLTQKEIMLSEGKQEIDLVYISDVINAYLTSLDILINSQKPINEHYAVGTGQAKSLREVVQLFEKCIQQSLPINWGARPYRAREVMNIWNTGKTLPGWHATISLEEGLKKILGR